MESSGNEHLGLNMKVYRDLVDKEKNEIGKKTHSRREEREENWGIFNKNLASIINDKHRDKERVSSLVYEELYKQSEINKDLFEKGIGEPTKQETRVEFNPSSSNDHYVSSEDFQPQTSMASEKSFDDSFDESQEYDRNKYENINVQQAIANARNEKPPNALKVEEVRLEGREGREKGREEEKARPIEVRSIEKEWMNNEIMRKSDRTVNSYLNCDL